MRLSNSARRRRTIGLTSLIDVVFLLLVFFMLSSTFLKFGTVAIDTAGAASGGAQADLSKIVLIHIDPDEKLRVNGAETAKDALPEKLDELVANGVTEAVVIATPRSTVGDLISGLTAVRRSTFSSVRVVN